MTPAAGARAARQWIEGYGAGRFRITGTVHEGSVIVFADHVEAWAPRSLDEIDATDLVTRLAAGGTVDVVLLGCGSRSIAVAPPALVAACRGAAIVVEAMDTGAACRTWNVLHAEDRRVAAALLAVG